MPAIFGNIVKINASKKLMVKIQEKTFNILQRIKSTTTPCGVVGHLPYYTLENDEGETNYFCMVTLDKYDKLRMDRFEEHIKSDVVIQYRQAKYDFVKDEKRIHGVNLLLQSIGKYRGKEPLFPPAKSQDDFADEEKGIDEIAHAIGAKTPTKMPRNEFFSELWRGIKEESGIANTLRVLDDSDEKEIDEIADAAAVRATSTETELNEEEQEIDDAVMAQIAGRFNLPPPPPLVRRRRTSRE